jgi:glycosyltransferase involved in cell wall biosynthesis
MFVVDLGHSLAGRYRHTLLHEVPVDKTDFELTMHLQGAGIDVLQADRITPELLDKGGYTGAILYNVEDHPGLGDPLPTMYYSYGVLDRNTRADLYVPCSKYACSYRRYPDEFDGQQVMDPEFVIPPMLQTRMMRRIKAMRPKVLMVGILTSGYRDKYPCKQVIRLLDKLPAQAGIVLNTLPKYKHPGVAFAIEARKRKSKNRTWLGSVLPGVGVQYLLRTDILIAASAENHREPAGRMVMEAMALGKAVIAERKGVFAESLEHGVNCLLYDTIDEAVDHVMRLGRDTSLIQKLGANAQMFASWQDMTVHMSRFKRMLRMIGA